MGTAGAVLDRLVCATNAHDLEELVSCFAAEYVNEAPTHPSRGFRGRDQVRRNWQQIFAFVPDVHAEVVRRVVDGDTVWSEWEMTGTRRDGTPHRMCGVIIFRARDDAIVSARFYLEPVDESDRTVGGAVRDQVVRG
jgi:ketosteroid isomerase-like protein